MDNQTLFFKIKHWFKEYYGYLMIVWHAIVFFILGVLIYNCLFGYL